MKYEQIALKKIGEAIGIAIKQRGMSLMTLERQSGVSRTIIYKVLRGENYEISGFIRIMRVLRIHLEISLLSENDNLMTMWTGNPSRS